ncbi:MAG: alpha-amylase [Candidatus Woesearchaeota archaeon]|nr:alpha-amylase [Candidatus Woesearchaeota archaeon]
MVEVNFYFQVHQPYRVRDFRVFEIGKNIDSLNQNNKTAKINKKIGKKFSSSRSSLVRYLLDKAPTKLMSRLFIPFFQAHPKLKEFVKKHYLNFYFQVHQPYRMRDYRAFDIGKNHGYFDEKKNAEIIKKVSKKCYLPMNALLMSLLEKYPEFKVTFSFSGVFLDQLEQYAPHTLESFKKLVKHKNVEILGETYYHSLAYLYSIEEFVEQVKLHTKKIKEVFGKEPKVFRNTELIYDNNLAKVAQKLGFKAVITEGADHILGWRSPNYVYYAKDSKMPLLLKNYRLSDDIAFRFSNRAWKEWPLTVDKYVSWINQIDGVILNLFMDYETFGEHQWKDTGIFDFMKHLPKKLLEEGHGFITPSEAVEKFEPVGEVDVPHLISWADIERDISAWRSNAMQDSALEKIYSIEKDVKELGDKSLLEDWRKLQTSDHFYYMCTKYFSDGDVHKYFNPYESPYEAFIFFMNIFQDLKERINALKREKAIQELEPEEMLDKDKSDKKSDKKITKKVKRSKSKRGTKKIKSKVKV